jgi:hypothetical protein
MTNRQNGRTEQRRLFKWKVAIWTFYVSACVAFFGAVSFVYVKAPTIPDPTTGAIYPLNNHGYVTYLTRRADLTREGLFIICGVAVGIAILIDFVIAPFRHERK